MSDTIDAAAVVLAAKRWLTARTAILKLTANDARYMAALNELSEAEDALAAAARPGSTPAEPALKRFLLFKGFDYYPCGGWDDFVGSFDSVGNAMACPDASDWCHVIDALTGERIDP